MGNVQARQRTAPGDAGVGNQGRFHHRRMRSADQSAEVRPASPPVHAEWTPPSRPATPLVGTPRTRPTTPISAPHRRLTRDDSDAFSTPRSMFFRFTSPHPEVTPQGSKSSVEVEEEAKGGDEPHKFPVLFRWPDKSSEPVYVVGSWDGFEKQVQLLSGEDDCVVAIDLPAGEYKYRYLVNGVWQVDARQELTSADAVTPLMNVIRVSCSDFDVLAALEQDQNYCQRNIDAATADRTNGMLEKWKEFGQEQPDRAFFEEVELPPALPPQIAGKPKADRMPSHVRFNRLYAQRLFDGEVLALSTTVRLRKKAVNCILYVPSK